MDVYFDISHDEGNMLEEDSDEGFSLLRSSMEELGYTFMTIEDDFAGVLRDLPPTSMVWVSCPRESFSKPEILAIMNYVRAGGGLLLLAEWGDLHRSASILNRFLHFLNVRFNTDLILDVPLNDRLTKVITTLDEDEDILEDLEIEMELDDMDIHIPTSPTMGEIPVATVLDRDPNIVPHAESFDDSGVSDLVRVRTFADHPLTSGLGELLIVKGCSLTAPQEMVIAQASEASFGDVDMNRQPDEGEMQGNIPVAAALGLHVGRITCIGDTSFTSNRYLQQSDNFLFMQRVFSWLTGTT